MKENVIDVRSLKKAFGRNEVLKGLGLGAFWRSRPIASGQWFLTKYLTGALVLMVTLSLPMIVCSIAVMFVPDLPTYRFPLALLVSLPLHLLVFTAATCLICVSRQPFYSALLATFVAFVLRCVPRQYEALSWMRSDEVIGTGVAPNGMMVYFDFDTASYVAYAGTLLGLTAATFVICYVVVKRRPLR